MNKGKFKVGHLVILKSRFDYSRTEKGLLVIYRVTRIFKHNDNDIIMMFNKELEVLLARNKKSIRLATELEVILFC